MKDTKEKVSYTVGLETGRNLRNQFSDIDAQVLLEGFQDGLMASPSKLPQEEIQAIIGALQKQAATQQKAFVAQLAERNKKEGEDFLQKNKNRPEVTTLPSGLQYVSLAEGQGPNPTLFDTVLIHYKGYLINGKTFDSSYERDQPQVLPVDRLIAGWSEALQKMRVGDKWQLFVPSYLAYGEQGFGPHIPPNTTLLFDMELLAINPSP